MVNRYEISAVVVLFIAAFLLGAGSVLFGDSYTTMHQIQTQGLLGQAAYEQQYESALSEFRWSVIMILFGLSGFVFGSVVYLVGELKVMMNE